MVLINAASYGVSRFGQTLMQKYKPITVISWVFLFGFIYVIHLGWNEFQAIEWTSIPQHPLESCFCRDLHYLYGLPLKHLW